MNFGVVFSVEFQKLHVHLSTLGNEYSVVQHLLSSILISLSLLFWLFFDPEKKAER